ncbi:hypothetical protein ACIRJO_28095 [Streptomyces sp. NPDC102394]|uniref:hypothetical protein n=1 Tax=Streptomyces sp. NPDC102394 TaxID=3366167 RepID=UPI00381AF20C
MAAARFTGDIGGDRYDDLVVGRLSGVDETVADPNASGGVVGVYYDGHDSPAGAAGSGAPQWWSQTPRSCPVRESRATPGATTCPSPTSTVTDTRTSPSARPARTRTVRPAPVRCR